MPYRAASNLSPAYPVLYKPLDSTSQKNRLPYGEPSGITASVGITEEMMISFTKHTFAAEDRFKPLNIEVNGRKNRRFVTVIAEDLRYLRIFDLDFKEEDGEAVGIVAEKRGRFDEDSDMLD
jgi:anaphase-promoting complex subunit 4